MDINLSVQQLRAERPNVIEAVQRLIAASDPAARNDLNIVLTVLLEMQGDVHAKRRTARSMIRHRTIQSLDGRRTVGYVMWHVPDVMIRGLCEIGEVERKTAPTDEWLDEMAAKANARLLPDGYREIE